jgi:hypothetical protein
VQPVDGSTPGGSVDRLIIRLRAYQQHRPAPDGDRHHLPPSEVVVVFDTETSTDQAQRLEFGAYQVRVRGHLIERGLFYAADLPKTDLAVLRNSFSEMEPTDDGERIRLLSVSAFIWQILYGWGLETGGAVVGFNLPFDLSRLAIRYTYARQRYKGGFSFTLANGRPNIRIKRLSSGAAFMEFAGRNGDDKHPDRGCFIDVRTFAAALTGGYHSLQSLTRLLGVTPKSPLDDYSGPLTPEKVDYGLNDVHATWEAFAALKAKFDSHGLAGVDPSDLYSEASLGKAFLAAMGIKPWRQVQPDFPSELIGLMMSTYYGGRAEIWRRGEIVPVLHCDFRSMYPTVSILMGLWSFEIVEGIDHRDATKEVRAFVATCTREDLQRPETWRKLVAIVEIEPDGDILPVRATFPGASSATIGCNPLRSPEPLWFALPDVVAAKMRGGKAPKIKRAIAFSPQRPQEGLRPHVIEGVRFDPRCDDFHKFTIDQRGRYEAAAKVADEPERARLKAAAQGLKILANSTCYGIFVELNVETLDQPRRVRIYDHRGRGRWVKTNKIEKPGAYFHPLLATITTAAARLMLALAEVNALARGLDWAFCDTDSLAIANTAGFSDADFIAKVQAVRAWFEPLNPYEIGGSILQLEKVNFPPGRIGDMQALRPVNCLAVSAKRYTLFDRDESGAPVIRKASGHGLGQYIPPYTDPDEAHRRERIERIGVDLWEEDLWKAIIAAVDAGHPDQVDYASLPNFDQPVASRYAATKRTQLGWFDEFNAHAPPDQRVGPFNFLLSFQAKSRLEMIDVDPDALSLPIWKHRTPRPASRFSTNLTKDPPEVFDRATGEPIPWSWLKTYARALARHHMHPELKFRGGGYSERGRLSHRNVHAAATIAIGKEADNLEERESLGEGEDDAIEWAMGGQDRQRLVAGIEEVLKTCRISDRALLAQAQVGRQSLAILRQGGRIAPQSLLNMAAAAEALRLEAQQEANGHSHWRQVGLELKDALGGYAKLADRIGLSRQYVMRALKGQKPMTDTLVHKLKEWRDSVRLNSAEPGSD